MHISKLRGLVEEAFTHPNYRFKGKEECREGADKSFDRLPPNQKVQVTKNWFKYLVLEKEMTADNATAIQNMPSGTRFKQLFDEFKLFRFVAQTNLFFLCHLLEKYSQTTIYTHEEVCNKFFVQKDPTYVDFEAFADQYTDLKERMLLVPRGGFKSSIDCADCLQWVICFPAVTIAIITGTLPLAKGFVGEIKQHVTLEATQELQDKRPVYSFRNLQDKATREWTPSAFQALFSEHCSPEKENGPESEWQTPAGGDDKEATIRAAAIETTLSGWHFGILKLDDTVTNENSLTPSRMVTVNNQISVNNAMLHPYGFVDVIGTWYDEQDYYGITIKHQKSLIDADGEAARTVKVYLRAAWWPTEQAVKDGLIEDEMKEKDWVLWFPERLTYKFLLGKKKESDVKDGGALFAIKYLNDPTKTHKVKFPRELLLRKTIPHTQIPSQGFMVATVDTAYSTKSWADYTVMITALIFGGRFYILNMVRGRYNEYDLPRVIASTGFKWKPKRIAIEESVGVKWFGRELQREMNTLKISIPIQYVSLGLGSKANSKRMKAKPVLRLLGDDRLFFANSCEGLNEIYEELSKFTGTADDTHDDIVSALSILVDQFGAYAEMESRINMAMTDYVADQQSAERHAQIYCLGKYAKYNQPEETNPETLFDMENLGANSYEQDTGYDPLDELL